MVYWRGSLILMYRSREIRHRLRMEAVEHITSELEMGGYRAIKQQKKGNTLFI